MAKEEKKPDVFEYYDVNTENEQVVLASLMKSSKMRERILLKVLPIDFIGKRHRNIFTVLKRMEKEGLEFNEDTFMQMAGDADIGNAKYLRKLLSSFEKNANIDFHIEQLKTDRLKFALFKGPVLELAEACTTKGVERKELLRLSNLVNDEVKKETEAERVLGGEDVSQLYLEDLEERMDTSRFVGTGLPELDKALVDGLSPGTVSVLSGRPSMGKTILMVNIISHLMRSKKMLICEIEQGNVVLLDMLVALHTGISLELLIKQPHKLDNTQRKRIKRKVRQLLTNPNLCFLDDPSLTLDRLAMELKNRRYDICFVDLFGRLADVLPTPDGYTKKLYQAKRIARETDTHLSLVHQMKRTKLEEKNRRPSLEKLKDSGAWEEVGDLIFGVHREKMYKPQLRKDVAEVFILKQKRGESNIAVPFRFTGEICEFGDYIKDYVYGRDLNSF